MTVSSEFGSAWLSRLRPAHRARVRLVCLPHAGGAASVFHPLARAMPPSTEVVAVQYPGRHSRLADPLVTDSAEMVRSLVAAIAPALDRPLVLLGHSMGAILAFEVARRLQERGTPAVGLIASAMSAPALITDRRTHLLDDAGIIAEISRLGGSDTELLNEPDLWSLIVPPTRADFELINTYRAEPEPLLHCPVVAYWAAADPDMSHERCAAWAAVTTGGFRLRRFDGGHFYLQTELPELVRGLEEDIGRLAGTTAGA